MKTLKKKVQKILSSFMLFTLVFSLGATGMPKTAKAAGPVVVGFETNGGAGGPEQFGALGTYLTFTNAGVDVPHGDIQVEYQIDPSSTAESGDDYTINGQPVGETHGFINIPAGTGNVVVSLLPIDDNLPEADEETAIINLLGVSTTDATNPVTLGANTRFTFNIGDNDSPVTVNLPSSGIALENETFNGGFIVRVNHASPTPITFQWKINTGGTATLGGANADFTVGSSDWVDATLPANATQTFIDLGVIDDSLDEADETINIEIGNVSANAVLGSNQQVFSILDDDGTLSATVGFMEEESSASESVSSQTYRLNLTAPVANTVTVHLGLGAVIGGNNATVSTDFNLGTDTVIFAPGETEKLVNLSIVNDSIDEADESVLIFIESAENINIAPTKRQVIHTILNDDAPAPLLVSLSSPAVSAAESETGSFTVNLNRTSTDPVGFQWRTRNSSSADDADFGNGSNDVFVNATIPAGQTSVSIPLGVVDDHFNEADETIIIEIANPSVGTIGTADQVYTILNNDPVVHVGINSAGTSLIEGGSSAVVFGSSVAAEEPITIDYALSGTADSSDLSFGGSIMVTGTVEIPVGATTTAVSLVTSDDADIEGDETVNVIITGVHSSVQSVEVGTNNSFAATIIDNDGLLTLNFTSAVGSGTEDQPGAVTVTLNRTSTQPVSFRWRAEAETAVAVPTIVGDTTFSADFAAPTDWTTVTIPAGQQSATFFLDVINDNLFEIDETIGVSLDVSDPGIEPGSIIHQTYTILANDIPTVQFETATSTGTESVTAPTLRITLSNASPFVTTLTFEADTVHSGATWGDVSVSGNDVQLATPTVTVPAGEVSANVTLSVADDSAVEVDELAIVYLAGVVGGVQGPNATHTYTIINNDPTPTPPTPPSGGGGGGSGGGSGIAIPTAGPSVLAPENFSVRVDSLTTIGDLTFANLVLSGGSATRMAFSNSANFDNATQIAYSPTAIWKLSSGNGVKTIYAKFFNTSGAASEPTSTTITVIGGNISGEVLGVQISLLDELIAKLKAGTTSDEVRQLQVELQKRGYFAKTFRPSRLYGSMTRAAVARYLADKKMASMTLDELIQALKFGTRNSMVTRLQNELKKLGHFSASVTGYYGAVTKAAVAKYQASK
jgi:hypothetical protein